jgi:hypothetical protein
MLVRILCRRFFIRLVEYSEVTMRRLICVFLLVATTACSGKQPANAPQPKASSAVAVAPFGAETPVASTETAVAPEVNPPGDIPDTQAFVIYRSAVGGYQLDVPEGWARAENGAAVSFIDKFNGVSVSVASASAVPTVASVRAGEAMRIASSGHAVTITDVSEAALPIGRAVGVRYTSNSDVNPVTNKRLRLDNETFLYFRNGREATLTLWAPQGADNVDQWNRMSRSFRWQ